MPQEKTTDIHILSLRGGENTTDPPNALPEDQCVLAQNVEFFYSMMGERRNGCDPLTLTGSGILNESVAVHVSQWYPLNDVLNPEFIAAGAIPGTSIVLSKRTAGVWSDITQNDAIDFSNNDIYNITTQTINGLNFIAYHSAVDRLHLWDGTTLRRAGIAQPGPPTAANEGGGAFTGTRYYRVRFTNVSGSIVLERSEPSTTLTFTPSGAGAGATITEPATIAGETFTNWELEASTDNVLFYRINSQAFSSTTYTDTTVFATGYASQGPLSEAIGSYLTIGSVKYLAVDGDRLVFAGHWTDATRASQIGWTPVTTDPGVGNSERFPIVTTGGTPIVSDLNLDNYNGGPITGIAATVFGVWYAFKYDHIYMMQRTNDPTGAYSVITLSQSQGALQGSLVKGQDENGAACLYYLDPQYGPSRVTTGGIEIIAGERGTWGRVNLQPSTGVVARGCFYPYKQQIKYWLALDGSNSPSAGLTLQISSIQQVSGITSGAGGVARGWSSFTGRIAQAYCVAVFTELVTISGVTTISERPFIGLTSPDFIQRCDVDSTDAGVAYTAKIITRPYFVTGLLNRWGVMRCSILAAANSSANLTVSLIRDFGVETSQAITMNLAPVAAETFVNKDFDNLVMSQATAIQIVFTG